MAIAGVITVTAMVVTAVSAAAQEVAVMVRGVSVSHRGAVHLAVQVSLPVALK